MYVLVLFRKLNITTELNLKTTLTLCNVSTFTEEIVVFQHTKKRSGTIWNN